jgi:hypothetical protein
MLQSPGGTVYVLGAGASAHAGAPLLRDFIVTARHLLESQRVTLPRRQAFELALGWIDSLRSSAYYVDLDLDNLEHVFSVAELLSQVGDETGRAVADALGQMIAVTLDMTCAVFHTPGAPLSDPTYAHFASSIRPAYNEDRRRDLVRDAVITFNYDSLLDTALVAARREIDYGLDEPPRLSGFPLYKLHGSVNWGVCTKCQGKVQVVKASALPPHTTLEPFSKPGLRVELKWAERLSSMRCEGCKVTGALRPKLIPPTWSKRVADSTDLGRVWKAAINALERATRLVAIGYSMPPTDTFFQYLCALGFRDNHRLEEIVVVTHRHDSALEDRYRRVFARSMHDRGKLSFVNMPFKDYVGNMRADEFPR